MKYGFNFRELWVYKGLFIDGLAVTLQISLVVLFIGLLLGLIVALLRLANSRSSKIISRFYIEASRNCPTYVLLLWGFYVLPMILELKISAFFTCCIALGINAAGFMAENFRAGIQSVERGQIEAGYSLGLSHFQTLRKIVMPQAIKVIIPPLLVEVVEVIKWSSLVSVLGVADLTFVGDVLSNKIFRPIETYTIIAGMYFIICYVVSRIAKILEMQFKETS